MKKKLCVDAKSNDDISNYWERITSNSDNKEIYNLYDKFFLINNEKALESVKVEMRKRKLRVPGRLYALGLYGRCMINK